MSTTTSALAEGSQADTEPCDNPLAIRQWKDPIVERVGFDACGDYVELFWLPIIGPTSTLLLRRLAISAVLYPNECSIDRRATAVALGLGSQTASSSSFARSVERLKTFGLARRVGSVLEVRTIVPPLTLKQLSRLPDNLQTAHSLWSHADSSDVYSLAYGPLPTAKGASVRVSASAS